ncbi:MAG: C1 family peptidase [Draconibacterium sp.]|nr:C1 family peptidase [Draconibacterium sp.]
MKLLSLLFALVLVSSVTVFSQDEKENFTIVKELKHTSVISQGSTGTCWSFATTSFLESEIMRKGLPETDLSEMYFVAKAYKIKAKEYLLYHGNNNFSQGGQAHDVLDVIRKDGVVTEKAYPGKKINGRFRHRGLVNELNQVVAKLNKKRKNFNAGDLNSLNPILKEQIGKIPRKIKTDNGKVSPIEFAADLQINPDDYIEISSYMHHPFYKIFVLEVPDNWSHAFYYNLPINELIEVIYYSLENGFTVAWDGDTSEKTFQNKKGKADLPKNQIGKVDQELRQETFLTRKTTDDHLMHLVGLSKDSEGKNCFYTKNSWGAGSNDFGGYLHMTEDYARLKTIAILVNKDAIPDYIKTKLNL